MIRSGSPPQGLREEERPEDGAGRKDLQRDGTTDAPGRSDLSGEQILSFVRSHPCDSEGRGRGSLRRMKETVGDIDIVAASEDPDSLADDFAEAPFAEESWPTARRRSLSLAAGPRST